MILAIDPGTTQSALVQVNAEPGQGLHSPAIVSAKILANHDARFAVRESAARYLAMEMTESYGQRVGWQVFETTMWAGRMVERWADPMHAPRDFDFVFRTEVKLALCNSRRAKDADIRQAIVDRYGGSDKAAKGTKASPGPLYGIRKDLWAALAIALTVNDGQYGKHAERLALATGSAA